MFLLYKLEECMASSELGPSVDVGNLIEEGETEKKKVRSKDKQELSG